MVHRTLRRRILEAAYPTVGPPVRDAANRAAGSLPAGSVAHPARSVGTGDVPDRAGTGTRYCAGRHRRGGSRRRRSPPGGDGRLGSRLHGVRGRTIARQLRLGPVDTDLHDRARSPCPPLRDPRRRKLAPAPAGARTAATARGSGRDHGRHAPLSAGGCRQRHAGAIRPPARPARVPPRRRSHRPHYRATANAQRRAPLPGSPGNRNTGPGSTPCRCPTT